MKKICWLILSVALLLARTAWAAEGGESFFERNELQLEFAASVFNFVLFAWILVRFAGPKLKSYFETNAQEYQIRLSEANKLLADAQALYSEWATRRQQIEEDTARYRADAERLAKAQADEIIQNARLAAQRIIAEAERTASSELNKAKDELRGELVAVVFDKTTAILQSRLTPSHQHMLIEEALKKLEASL